ncbi:MAG: copper chaperone PCu(A)C [Sinobacteraceae bacterium]|nr:copper chaperone PCu(A)C [Nevskiaceae bacterium]
MASTACRFAAAALVVPALAACHGNAPQVADAWLSLPVSDAGYAQGYFSFRNPGDRAVSIVGVSCYSFLRTYLSNSDTPIDAPSVSEVPVAPHASVRLAPGGLHLQLYQPNHSLTAGERLPCSLTLRDAQGSQSLDFKLEVRAPSATK